MYIYICVCIYIYIYIQLYSYIREARKFDLQDISLRDLCLLYLSLSLSAEDAADVHIASIRLLAHACIPSFLPFLPFLPSSLDVWILDSTYLQRLKLMLTNSVKLNIKLTCQVPNPDILQTVPIPPFLPYYLQAGPRRPSACRRRSGAARPLGSA